MKSNAKLIILVVVLLLLFVGVFFGAYSFLQSERQTVPTIVYQADLKKNDVITKADLTVFEAPATSFSSFLELDPNEIIGKVAANDVYAGEFVYKSHLKEVNEIDPFETIDLSKMRKVALPVNIFETLGGNITRGQTVDLVYTGSAVDANDQKFTYSRTFIENALVYDVYTNSGVSYINAEKVEKNDDVVTENIGSAADEPKILVLAVPLEQVEEIQARLDLGQISIAGRFDASESYETMGYAIGGNASVFSGSVLTELDSIKFNQTSSLKDEDVSIIEEGSVENESDQIEMNDEIDEPLEKEQKSTKNK